MAVTVLLISNIIFDALGKSGLFCWSVCLQMLLVSVVLNLSEHDQFCLNLCCEELMTNIAQHSHGHVVHHLFDIHIYSDDEGTCVTLKDGGKPFNPLLAGKMADPDIGKEGCEHLGLRLVAMPQDYKNLRSVAILNYW